MRTGASKACMGTAPPTACASASRSLDGTVLAQARGYCAGASHGTGKSFGRFTSGGRGATPCVRAIDQAVWSVREPTEPSGWNAMRDTKSKFQEALRRGLKDG